MVVNLARRFTLAQQNASITDVYAIILAAGASTRLGKPKQLILRQGKTLLEQTIHHAQALLGKRVKVVLGARATQIQRTVNLETVDTIINPEWSKGMASSIRAGIKSLPSSTSAALFLLCDQPLINKDNLQSLLRAWQIVPQRIVASEYNQSLGVPALFPAAFFKPLSELNGDRGAKSLLMKFKDEVLAISMPEAELDIDSPENLDLLSDKENR